MQVGGPVIRWLPSGVLIAQLEQFVNCRCSDCLSMAGWAIGLLGASSLCANPASLHMADMGAFISKYMQLH